MKIHFGLVAMGLLTSNLSWAGSYPLKVTEKGFEPESITVPSGEEVTLKVTRTTENTCAKELQVPSKKLKAKLPLNKEVSLSLGALPKGEVKFACGMSMMSGVILAK